MRLKRSAQRHWSPDPNYLSKVKEIHEVLHRAQTETGTVALYEDEAFAHLRPTLTRWYSAKGQAPIQLGTGTVDRTRCIFGAVNPVTGATYHLSSYNGAACYFVQFIDHLLARYPSASSLDIILDNWGVHDAQITNDFLGNHRKIHFHPLPTYSPWLNHQEKLWKAWRKTVTHGHPFKEMNEILDATDSFFDDLKQHKSQVLQLIGQSGN